MLTRAFRSGVANLSPCRRSCLTSRSLSHQAQGAAPRRSWGSSTARTLILGTAIGAGCWVGSGDKPYRRIKLLYIIPLRMARNVVTASEMVSDYMSSLYGIPEGSVEMENARHEVHLRNAERLKNLCFKNGGIYIKLGQHIGQLDYLVPREFVQTMRNSTLNKCPIQTFAQVRDVFLAELGLYPSEVFAEFSEVPMASASLAQVHAARTHDGRKVAVKVQHTHLTETSDADIHTVNFIVHVGHWLFPHFDYRSWIS